MQTKTICEIIGVKTPFFTYIAYFILRTVQSVESARKVVYRFVAGNVRSDDAVSGLNLRIDDSAVQQVQRRP